MHENLALKLVTITSLYNHLSKLTTMRLNIITACAYEKVSNKGLSFFFNLVNKFARFSSISLHSTSCANSYFATTGFGIFIL